MKTETWEYRLQQSVRWDSEDAIDDVIMFIKSNFSEKKHKSKYDKEKELFLSVVDGVINAESGKDLHVQLLVVNKWDWLDSTRRMFLIGLLQGALMQFKRDVAIEELRDIFSK